MRRSPEKNMDKCSKCGADTQIYETGNPICVKCSEETEAARKRTAKDKTDRGGSPDPRSIGESDRPIE